MVRSRVLAIDPDAAHEAHLHAREDRHVSGHPVAGVGMAGLTAVLPAEQVAACWHALDDHARSARADGDTRTVSQIMADTLVERLTGQARACDVPAHVGVVMTDHTLVGLDDRPAQLGRFGPVTAPVARLLATTGSTWLRGCSPTLQTPPSARSTAAAGVSTERSET